MAISWLTVLQAVPWTEVIKNAPKVADGAKKLWNTVGGKGSTRTSSQPVPSADDSSAGVRARVAELEGAVAELQTQMLASSEVIKSLAEQNAQLVQRVELHRRRTLGLMIVVLGLVAYVLVTALVPSA